MNRDHIDFTKTGKCCLCGEEKQLSECWDCLFDVNRRGRRKKILKIRSIEKAVNSMLR